MLSQNVLAQLTKSTPLREALVKTAWPSLCVESKLQVIDAIAADRSMIPEFLTDLALADNAAVVRFWGARFTHFTRPRPDFKSGITALDELLKASEQDAQRSAKADSDRNPLVRAAALNDEGFGPHDLEKLPHFGRLLALRTCKSEQNEKLAQLIQKQLASDLTPATVESLREYLFEYFESEAFKSQFDELHVDGYGEYRKGHGMDALWDLTATTPEGIAHVIAWNAVLDSPHWRLQFEKLLMLPNFVKEIVLNRPGATPQMLRDHIQQNPEQHSAAVNDALNQYYRQRSEFGEWTDEQRRRRRLESSLDRTGSILEIVLKLEAELSSLRTELQQLKESKKRGFFNN